MKGCCSGSSKVHALEKAVTKSHLFKVRHLLQEMPSISSDEVAKLTALADQAVAEKELHHRTILEKIMLYGAGALATFYTLNLIAYTFIPFLRDAMYKTHGLQPNQIYPIAFVLILLLSLFAYRGWQGPYNRLARAKIIRNLIASLPA